MRTDYTRESPPARQDPYRSRHWESSRLIEGGGYAISSSAVRRIVAGAHPRLRERVQAVVTRLVSRMSSWVTALRYAVRLTHTKSIALPYGRPNADPQTEEVPVLPQTVHTARVVAEVLQD